MRKQFQKQRDDVLGRGMSMFHIDDDEPDMHQDLTGGAIAGPPAKTETSKRDDKFVNELISGLRLSRGSGLRFG